MIYQMTYCYVLNAIVLMTSTSMQLILCVISIICSCMAESAECVPTVRPRASEVSGWNDQVKPERDRSLFWHWIWLESGKPNTGFVYQIMKRTRHQYHYAVRCCKKNAIKYSKTKVSRKHV